MTSSGGQTTFSQPSPGDELAYSPLWVDIADYAIIGDCHSAALVARDGSIDWLCWPRFDSASLFARLLDPDHGGFWRISPPKDQIVAQQRRYIEHTNVLETSFHTRAGDALLTDLMPVVSEQVRHSLLIPDHELIRQIQCTEGEIGIEFFFQPRPCYGQKNIRFRHVKNIGVHFDFCRGTLYLRCSVPLHYADGKASARFVLRRGESAQFSFTYSEDGPVVVPPLGDWTCKRIEESVAWWRAWCGRAQYDGPARDAVLRSALTLKLLTYSPSGAVVAAATTSLPERIGGRLNWDYRFCWLRDASLTIRSMIGLGYYAEADAFMNWLLYATRLTQPELRILYTVFGQNPPREREVSSLRGYRDSRPVRIGNAARDQIQLDVYGEVLDAAAQYAFHGGELDRTMQRALIDIGKYVCQNWDSPDQGIWEPREGPQHHTHSRLLCWTALDRLATMCDKKLIKGGPIDDFKRERHRIADQVKRRAWNCKLQSYVSTLDGDKLDASLLLMSYYGFEAANSERMQSTYGAISRSLRAGDHLVYRYVDGSTEGAFGICSFWEVDFLALGGSSLSRAQQLFDQLLKYRNDVGLYAEEIDPNNGAALGNFPQAFTHVGLISAAISITERMQGEKQLAHREPTAEENMEKAA